MPRNTKRISSGAPMQFGVHYVDTHIRKMDLMVVYTNDPLVVEDSINTMERFIVVVYKYKVVGFDLVYRDTRAGHDQKVVVAQLCVRHHVLLYHYYLGTMRCEHFTRFVKNPDYMFTTADTTSDTKVLKTSGLSCHKLVDIYDHYQVWDCKKDKESLV
ncbi:hypothetical protein D1007_47604 [Hordeum vulgare]|nr:hypothetical protein D1007_47604 [Hordeum vulgare]